MWETPDEIVEYLSERYGEYDLDAAATEGNKNVISSTVRKQTAAKDILDNSTIDGVEKVDEMDIHELQHGSYSSIALRSGGHYQPVRENTFLKWETPDEIVEYLSERYGEYDLDAAATEGNKNVISSTVRKQTAVKSSIFKSRSVCQKAIEQMEHGNQIDILLPADNSTAWFSDAVKHAAEVIWITGETWVDDGREYSRTGRLAFISGLTGESVQGNNKGSVIFIMRKLKEGEKQQTHYVPISEICPSVMDRRVKARSL
ncbi:DNA methyltransferase [Citrobacter phage HCF1]|uniref:DNA adenine methyltransferase n=1 Tax=Citrobacter phage HCF1 TaxID=2849700 RepID=A0ABX6D3N5_9CAUD|nr:DNA methyltransferase [Citrobacter phage HCF1]